MGLPTARGVSGYCKRCGRVMAIGYSSFNFQLKVETRAALDKLGGGSS